MKKTGWLYRNLRKGYLVILDLLTKKKGVELRIHDTVINLPGYFSRYFPKDYEKENFIFLKKVFNPGMTALDIGGHLGLYTIIMAKWGAARVYCFEPTPSTYDVLRKVIKFNNVEAIVRLSRDAIGERSGEAVFYLNLPGDNREKLSVAEANSLKYIDHGQGIKKKELIVKTIAVDDFFEREKTMIDFIKIDAEGAELDILRGAVNVFSSLQPSGIISLHCFTYKDRLKNLLEIWDYMEKYKMELLFENSPVTKEGLLNLAEKDIFDLQFTQSQIR